MNAKDKPLVGHTPAWPIDPYSSMDKEIYISAGDVRVMVDYDDVDHNEADRVAILISVTPELVKALQACRDVLSGENMTKGALVDALTLATSVLSKSGTSTEGGAR